MQMWARFDQSVRTGEPVFEKVHGVHLYDYFISNSQERKLFYDAMTALSKQEGLVLRDSYDFSNSRCVIDLGGGHGWLLIRLLQAYPEMRGILFDLAPVIEGAETVVRDSGVADRCTLVPGDLFESVPAGGDVYILKRILMDKDDEAALEVLANVREAMSASATLLIGDPDVQTPTGTLNDMLMLAGCGSPVSFTEDFVRYGKLGGDAPCWTVRLTTGAFPCVSRAPLVHRSFRRFEAVAHGRLSRAVSRTRVPSRSRRI